eukprot:SAG31_NODE_20079_length_584_cov_0.969072_2_plen_67_part_01
MADVQRNVADFEQVPREAIKEMYEGLLQQMQTKLAANRGAAADHGPAAGRKRQHESNSSDSDEPVHR